MIGITALVPAEIIYSSGNAPVDLNNFVPFSSIFPEDKLCAWSAIWRELVISGKVKIKKIVVVAGGDCYNALVDGERVEAHGIPAFYFIYPFDRNLKIFAENLKGLEEFCGGFEYDAYSKVVELKRRALEVDMLRVRDNLNSQKGFEVLVSSSDLSGNLQKYEDKLENIKEEEVEYSHRVALIGIPPIYPDFHEVLQNLGLHVVYDEMPYEFARLYGRNIKEVARSYSQYTFAGSIFDRLNFIEKELKRRKAEAIIHFQQFSCHHKLEDSLLRKRLSEELGYPYITIEADLPGRTPEQVKLRLEAFAERLGDAIW